MKRLRLELQDLTVVEILTTIVTRCELHQLDT